MRAWLSLRRKNKMGLGKVIRHIFLKKKKFGTKQN